jgi:hypothetical protein
MVRDTLPALADWWLDLTPIYSIVLQKAVERIRDNVENLGLAKLTSKGYDVGSLNWKNPREYQSFTYRQSGFELDNKSGPNGRGLLVLKQLRGDTRKIPIRLHRDLPDHDSITEVTLNNNSTGVWDVSVCSEADKPEKPAVESIKPSLTTPWELTSAS